MQFLSYLLLACVGSVVATPLAAPLAKRDASTVTADIGNIKAKTIALNNTITAFDGNLFKALPVYFASNDVQTAINKTINDAKASAPFDDAGSANVGLAVLDLQPAIFTTLDNLVSKKAMFDKLLIVSPIIKSSLQSQRTLSQQLGQAIVPKLTATYAALAPGVIQQIDAKFAQAIAAYSTTSSPF